MKGYARISNKITKNCNVPLPSYYMLTKNRPKLEDMSLTTLPSLQITNSGREECDEAEDDDIEMSLIKISNSGDEITGGRIIGRYEHYLELLVQKHVNFDRKICAGDDLIVIDSFDGAEHSKSNKNRTSLISFSSQMFTPSLINSGTITAGSSLNILTWQQMRATESYSTMMPAVNDYFKAKGLLYEKQNTVALLENCSISYYDMHDGKMLYLLTQHSL